MTEKEPSVGSVALKWGFIFALIGVVFSLILMVADLSENRWLSSLAYIILIVGIVVAMKNYKELNQGFMSYGQGLGIGSIVSAIFGFLSGLGSWLYIEFVDPEYMARVMEKQRVQMLEQGLTDEQIDAGMAMAENFQGPVTMILGATVVTLILGFILSLIISAVMKNTRPEFE
ncbi:DUF4199 domain-containing protein [Pontibacter korlensis]|uniref:DUF4199 domain-containing protein n=1 Tax=Pontibacter korlensis TaxID=400092 RepID=A0A0E3ZE63_9BACT|nr:DUF4199 domain-containing protein [Pontibacter korlensis]AKD03593.1 hypothetical protein PKOR_11205 [Pontibacter korlensis]